MARKHHFYTRVIETVSIELELDTLDLSPEEREDLAALADSTIHLAVVHELLKELPQEYKKAFLDSLRDENHDRVWNIITAHIHQPEEKIKRVVGAMKHELHGDIRTSGGKRAK